MMIAVPRLIGIDKWVWVKVQIKAIEVTKDFTTNATTQLETKLTNPEIAYLAQKLSGMASQSPTNQCGTNGAESTEGICQEPPTPSR